jgi:hypothetical protein
LSSSQQFPLSGVQHGFVDASGMRATKNTVPATYAIEGPFSNDGILKALARVVSRHEALRMMFGVNRGTAFQQVVDRVLVRDAVSVLDRPRRDGGKFVQAKIEEYLAMPFDLRQAPVWRGFLIQVDPQRWVLGLTFAHVIIDGSSVGVIAEDLAAALGNGSRPATRQVTEIALAESELRPTERQLAFWRTQYDARKPLPGTWDGDTVGTYHVIPIPPFERDLTSAFLDRMRPEEVSVTSMLGTLAGIAGRLLSRGDLMIGYATAQRAHTVVEGNNRLTVGAIHDHLPAMAVIDRGQTVVQNAVAHQQRRDGSRDHRLPTGHLARLVQRTPYDVAVNFGRFGTPQALAVDGGGKVTAVPVEAIGPVNVRKATTAAPPLAFIANRHPDGVIRGVMTGIDRLYTDDQIRRFPTLMRELAELAVAHPRESVGELRSRLS